MPDPRIKPISHVLNRASASPATSHRSTSPAASSSLFFTSLLTQRRHRPRYARRDHGKMLGAARRSVAALSRAGGAWHQWRVSSAVTIHNSSLAKLTKGDAKHTNSSQTNPPVIWSTVLSSARSCGYRFLPNLNQSRSSKRYVSTAIVTEKNHPPGERFKCQHETRGKLCKTLEKRNILDHKRRLLAYKYELRRKLYKAVCRDPDLPSGMRDKHRYKLSKLPKNSSFVRVRNRCIFTGRPRAVYRLFRMSRVVFREKASQGSLMGIKKSSW